MFSGSARLGEMPDHYDVLGVHHTASAKEIKRYVPFNITAVSSLKLTIP